MSADHVLTTDTAQVPATRETLLERVAFLGARPFVNQVVQSPWNAVVDAPSLHREVKERIRTVVTSCGQTQAIRCLTVVGSAGYGKTHLLAWTRQLLDERNDAVFIYVPPYTPGGQGSALPEQQVMGATLDALWLRSRRQQTCFEQAIRSFLVGCYDRVIDSGQGIKEVLRAGTFWSRLFRRSRLRLGPQGPEDHLAALQRAFDRRAFLERAFTEFNQRHPVGADGVRPDWDTFVAACLLACGDTRQRWHADRWFRGDRVPPDVLQPFHLDHPCQGTDKIRNGLFTLQRLVGQSFCLAFDQLEDTYLALFQPGVDKEAARFAQLFGVLLKNLVLMPGFCLLFSCQLAVWQNFAREAPPMLIDRMVEGYGAQTLPSLDDATARELVRERMRATVWSQLVDEEPPAGEPCCPFTAEEVRQMRIDTGGELRAFLHRAQQEFEQRLTAPPKPPLLTIHLTSIEPREVMSHEETPVLIRGENLPAEVQVLFAGQPASALPVCRPSLGEIDATTPVGLVGDVEVQVKAADDPGNGGTLMLRFMEREVPRPYREHIAGERLKARRLELGLNQKEVAERLQSSHPDISQLSRAKGWQPYISKLEKEAWQKAPDQVYVWLAEVYGMPLSSFLKHQA
jgi:hypothetical protein